ncbi:MAG: sigma-70 family RNA polymerase sigma factor [Myxococcota bacterium]
MSSSLRTPSYALVGSGSSDPQLARYLKLVRSQPRLSPEQEKELFEAYRDGDERAGEQLVLANLHLVVRIAFKYHARMGQVVDLVQEGNVGLLRALEKFDPQRGVPFSAYARYWIRAMVLRFLMENHHLASAANTREGRRLFWEMARERHRLESDGDSASSGQLARALGADESEVVAMSRLSSRELSLSDPGPDGGRAWIDVLPDPDAVDPEAELELRRRSAWVRSGVAQFAEGLGARDRRILEARIVAEDPATLGTLSDELGVSRERVRQLEVRIRSQLGQALGEVGRPHPPPAGA